MIIPWLLGSLSVYTLVRQWPAAGLLGAREDVTLYAIAFGLCIAVTALPVLMIILREIGFNQAPIGSVALAIGGIGDGLLWLSLAILLPFAASGGQALPSFALAIGGAIVVILLMNSLVNPFLNKLIRDEAPERFMMSAVFLVLFVAALITEYSGLHAVFGAFITGFLLPDRLRSMAQDKFDVPVSLLLLPFFFLATGLTTEINPGEWTIWIVVAVALTLCVGGKLIAVSLPAYLSGQSAAFSITLGVLMQCKGLTEIVVVTILRDKGVFGVQTFSALVIMALISSAITAPLARLCARIFGVRAATVTREEEHIAVTVAGGAGAAPLHAGWVLIFDHAIGVIPIDKNELVIGRHSTDDIRVDDNRVSRHHAKLKLLEDGRYEIHNQTAVRSEPNPILVNGQPKEQAVLSDGDVVNMGGVSFTLRRRQADAPAPQPASGRGGSSGWTGTSMC